MSWVIVGVVGGGLIGAGGSIAGGILSQPKRGQMTITPTYNPASDPLTALNTLDLLASQGVFASDVLQQAGPIQRAIQLYNAHYPLSKAGKNLNQYNAGLAALLAGDSSNEYARIIAREGGFQSVADLHAAQQKWEQEIAPRLETLKQIAAQSNQRQSDVEKGLSSIAAQPLDLNSLRDAELVRLNRQLDIQQTDALRAASAGGYNPGRQLEGIGNQRSDADLTALSRAVGYLSGQGQSIANLNALNPANRAQQYSPGVMQFRVPSIPGQLYAPQTTNPFGAAVAGASNQLGGALSSLGLIQMLNQKTPNTNPPAWTSAGYNDYGNIT